MQGHVRLPQQPSGDDEGGGWKRERKRRIGGDRFLKQPQYLTATSSVSAPPVSNLPPSPSPSYKRIAFSSLLRLLLPLQPPTPPKAPPLQHHAAVCLAFYTCVTPTPPMPPRHTGRHVANKWTSPLCGDPRGCIISPLTSLRYRCPVLNVPPMDTPASCFSYTRWRIFIPSPVSLTRADVAYKL